MPIYEYRCQKCGHEFEELVSMSAPPPACPKCESPTERMMSAAHKVTPMKVGTKASQKIK